MCSAAARASSLSCQCVHDRAASAWYQYPFREPGAGPTVKFSSAGPLVVPLNMGKPIRSTKKLRGRPKATETGARVGMRWQLSELAAIDEWRSEQESSPSRAEAIRRLVKIGLRSARPTRHRSPEAASKASQLAAEQVEKMLNPLLTEQERQSRSRRLIRGPKEFRGLRQNRSDRKR
jgi:hypothetical protein